MLFAQTLLRTAVALTALAACVPTALGQRRTWKDGTGKFSVEAELVETKQGSVELKKVNGTTITVPLARLSDEVDTVQEVAVEPAAPGLDAICEGIRLTSPNDETAIERGPVVYDALYARLTAEIKATYDAPMLSPFARRTIMRTTASVLVLALCEAAAFAESPKPQVWNFEDTAVGNLPSGWTIAKTGEGEGSIWRVVEDESAPGGSRALAQVAAGPRPLFNLCVVDRPPLRDLEISVAFKAVDGKVDQGGGVVWRYLDPNNYYIARFNPLEDNFRLYKVVDGKRVQLATKEALKAPAGQWHTLAVKMKSDSIECSLNGKKQLEAKDGTFAGAGKIGLWTKADAHTYFDKMEVKGTE